MGEDGKCDVCSGHTAVLVSRCPWACLPDRTTWLSQIRGHAPMEGLLFSNLCCAFGCIGCFCSSLYCSLSSHFAISAAQTQVFRQKLWMRHYGVRSWKSTCVWSNSSHIHKLNMGKLTKEMKAGAMSLAKTYRDKHGKKRCTGKKRELKESQMLGLNSR